MKSCKSHGWITLIGRDITSRMPWWRLGTGELKKNSEANKRALSSICRQHLPAQNEALTKTSRPTEALPSTPRQASSSINQYLGGQCHDQVTFSELDPSAGITASASKVFHNSPAYEVPYALQPTTDSGSEARGQSTGDMDLSTAFLGTAQVYEPTLCNELDATQQGQLKPAFKCTVEGCKAKPFTRMSELQRHRGKHSRHRYSCPAQGCNRSGVKGFYRLDKLRDHMLAGHDDDTPCTCPYCSLSECDSEQRGTSQTLTRDILLVHLYHRGDILGIKYVNNSRCCPIPRCPFRIFLGHFPSMGILKLDALQLHLLEHDQKGRANFKTKVRERGYDVVTGDVICPMCKAKFQHPGHSKFVNHLGQVHSFSGPDSAPEEVHPHRRTILSLWPQFEYSSIWGDIKCRGKA